MSASNTDKSRTTFRKVWDAIVRARTADASHLVQQASRRLV